MTSFLSSSSSFSSSSSSHTSFFFQNFCSPFDGGPSADASCSRESLSTSQTGTLKHALPTVLLLDPERSGITMEWIRSGAFLLPLSHMQ